LLHLNMLVKEMTMLVKGFFIENDLKTFQKNLTVLSKTFLSSV